MDIFTNYIKKHWVALALFIILATAFWVRFYNFDQWLYFKMDQSRDALLINNVVENGPEYLPLLGARAGATELKHGFLRLGPIFYYFQYASAMIFRSTEPYVLAYPDLFFSMAAILLLYFFSRLYFSRKHSLMITTMYAFSFIIIQYSRFSWNPNSLQFFLLLSFYGLLRFLHEGNDKRRKWWLALWAVGITVGSQLHFFGFFTLIGVSGLLILFHLEIWKKEKIVEYLKKDALKRFAAYAGIAFLVFAVFYTPVIISDVKNNGQNTKNFIEALGSKPANKPLGQKISKAITENLRYYCLVTTSRCYEGSMRNEIPAIVVTGLILFAGLILTLRGLRKDTTTKLRRDFLALLLIWVGVFSILTIPVSFQLRPRFFIVVFAIPFIFLGLLYEYLEERFNKKYALLAAVILTIGVISLNCRGTYVWFKEQAKSQKISFDVKRTLILKAKDGVTLGQLQRTADWIYGRHQVGKNLYYYVKPEHVRPLDYLFVEKNDRNFNFFNMKINEDPNAQYFAVTPAKSGISPVTKKFGPDMKIIAQEQFGQLMAYEIEFPNRVTSDTFKLKKESEGDDRLYWKDVFNLTKNK